MSPLEGGKGHDRFGSKRKFSITISRIAKEFDVKVEESLSKRIEHEIPYLHIDATYFKVRDGLHFENKGFITVAGKFS